MDLSVCIQNFPIDKEDKNVKKRVLSFLLAVALVCTMLPQITFEANALDSSYVVGNGVTVPNSNVPVDGTNKYCQCDIAIGTKGHWCCWQYGYNVFYHIWGCYPDRYNNSQHYLRNVSASDRTLTAAHLKQYLTGAKPGALLRIDKNSTPSAGDSNGHTLVFVKMNSSGNGAVFLEGNYDGRGRTRLVEWSFSNLISSYGPGSNSNYQYIKYILWPSAPAYSNQYTISFTDTGDTSMDNITVSPGSSVTLPTTVPHKFGENFDGWTYNGTTYQPGETFTPTGNMTLSGDWRDSGYENLGGDVMLPYSINYPGVGCYKNFTVAQSGHYTIMGWRPAAHVSVYDGSGNLLAQNDVVTQYFSAGQNYIAYIEPNDSSVGSKTLRIIYTPYGSTGNISWEVSGSTLTISGNGAIPDCATPEDEPWYEYRSQIDTLVIESGVTAIGYAAFSKLSNLQSVSIPNSVTSIGDYAFNGCKSLTSVTIPDSVITIGSSSFSSCSSLTSVYIGKNVSTIGEWAFAICENLTGVYISDLSAWCGMTFGDYFGNPLFYAGNLYLNGTLVTDLTIPEGVTAIGNYAFWGYTNLTGVTIPYSVTAIGDYAFYDCTNITDVYYGDNNAKWDQIAIGSNNEQLTSATIHKLPFTYTVNNGEVTITGCDTSVSSDLTIPAYIAGYPVTAIGDEAFYDCTGLTGIVIPKGVRTIGELAFGFCLNLATVKFSSGLTAIGNCAFLCCRSLTSAMIPDGTTTIGEDAFGECDLLEAVAIPLSVTMIDNYIFGNCRADLRVFYAGSRTQWTQINIPSGYDDWLAANCIEYNAVADDTAQRYLESDHNYAENSDATYRYNAPSGTEKITFRFSDKTELENKYDTLLVNGDIQFTGKEAAGVTVNVDGDSLSIQLTSDGSVQKYGFSLDYVVYHYSNVVASGTCGENATWSLDNDGGLTISGTGAMENFDYDSSGDALTRPWEQYADSIKSVVISDGITSIGDYAFQSCRGLESVTIPDSVITIGQRAFARCDGLLSVTIPYGVTTIGDYAFWDCDGLQGVIIPDSVITIGNSAFCDCDSLQSANIGDSVTNIIAYAFLRCPSLTGIWVDENNTAYCSDSYGVLFNKDKTTLIQAPGGISGSYIVPDSVTTIDNDAFYECTGLTSLTIPNGVTTIGMYAFYECTGLISLTIPTSVTIISYAAFCNCTSLTSLIIPSSVIAIAAYATYGCDSLINVYYNGTEDQWAQISIGESNAPLTNATLHFHTHSYTSATVGATCTAAGYTEYTCECGDSYREEIPAKGHDYSVTVSTTAPDCTQQGSTVKKCSRCDSTETTYTDALGHNMVTIPAVAPTCTETGLTAGTACDRCGEVGTAQTEVPATGHNYVNGVCSGCGDISNVNAPQIVVDTVESGAGKTVSVSISLKNNPGLVTMQLQVEYDSTVLTLKQVQDNGLLGSTMHNPTLGSPYTLRWANNTAAADFTANGAVVTLIFEVSEDAEEGYCPITVSYDYDNYDIMNWDMDAVKFDVVNGGVEIVNVIVGDVDGNGSVNNRDSMVLDRYLAKWPGYTEENVNLKAADVNGDGAVNNKDSMILARYLAKWPGYETLPYAR